MSDQVLRGDERFLAMLRAKMQEHPEHVLIGALVDLPERGRGEVNFTTGRDARPLHFIALADQLLKHAAEVLAMSTDGFASRQIFDIEKARAALDFEVGPERRS